MQIKQWNKKGVADITDPKFWGIVGAMWIIILIMVWKMSIGSETDTTKLKIMFSVISLPVIACICYLMGQEA